MRSVRTALALALAACLAGVAAQADADRENEIGELRAFSISAQPLAQALREFAEQSGVQIVFYSDVGKGRQSIEVEGRYTTQQALRKLLENTGLEHRQVNDKTVAITASDAGRPDASLPRSSTAAPLRLAQASAPARPSPAAARPVRGADGTPSETLWSLEEVIVTGAFVPAQTRHDASVAISTFDAQRIAQIASASTAELISGVPGFWVESTAGATQGNVFARGIIQDGGYRYVGLVEDGMPLYPVFELSFYNPDQFIRIDDTIARVEALRGGTAPILTSGAIGGVINFITRNATSSPSGATKVSVSDRGHSRADLVWSGPLGEQWGAALGGYYRRADGVRDPGYTADDGGQFRIKISRAFERGEIEVFAKYLDDRSLFVVPIPLQGDASDPSAVGGADPGTYSLHSQDIARAGLPASAAEVGLQDSSLEDGIHPQLLTAGARLQFELNEATTLTNLSRITDADVRFDAIFSGAAPVPGSEFAAERGAPANYSVLASGAPYAAAGLVQNHGRWVAAKTYAALQNDLRANLALGPHSLLLGLYLADYSMADRWSLGANLLTDVSDRPRRLALSGVTDARGFTSYSSMNLIADYDATTYSLYAADEWEANEALRLDVGLRYDVQQIDGAISTGERVDLDGDPATRYDNDTALAGRERRRVAEEFADLGVSVGFNYSLTDGHAIFGRYTRAAKLPHFDDVRNGAREKDNVVNVEFGYKSALDSLALFATVFQTEFDNVPFQDILAGGDTILRRAGTRTRGFELEGEYLPLPALSVRFSITHQAPEYRNFSGAQFDNTGNTIRRIPRTMARVTPTLAFLQDRVRAYLTYSYVGRRYANDENTIELPAYQKLDAGLMLDLSERWSVQLNADNLTDAAGLTEANPRTDVGAGPIAGLYMARPLFGRSFMGAVTYRMN